MNATERIVALSEGRDPLMIARMRSGFAVMSETQFLPGYCLLIAYPQVETLNSLTVEGRATFLADMTMLGDAVLRATECDRVNYGIYGNQDRFLHAHIVPRYEHEPAELSVVPPHSYPYEIRAAIEHAYDEARHRHLKDDILLMLDRLSTPS
jgi:diadenosine tetraphosphate (Ap4A) HIT family hydrolase